jgi:methylated-DNA-protein-cysteine methyltransferase-like protein
MEDASARIIALISKVPRGHVATYGQIAALAGTPNAARQVARLLHSSSGKHGLAWHRVINSKGMISLPPGGGYELQLSLLEAEGVYFEAGRVNFDRFGWRPSLESCEGRRPE